MLNILPRSHDLEYTTCICTLYYFTVKSQPALGDVTLTAAQCTCCFTLING